MYACSVLAMLAMGIVAFKGKELGNNEAALGTQTYQLNFGGLEEVGRGSWFENPNLEFFQSKIFLSDVHLNNTSTRVKNEIVLEIDNFSDTYSLEEGTYQVKEASYYPASEEEKVASVRIHWLDGKPCNGKVVNGQVHIKSVYPEADITFDLQLESGLHLLGSYSKELESFKSSF